MWRVSVWQKLWSLTTLFFVRTGTGWPLFECSYTVCVFWRIPFLKYGFKGLAWQEILLNIIIKIGLKTSLMWRGAKRSVALCDTRATSASWKHSCTLGRRWIAAISMTDRPSQWLLVLRGSLSQPHRGGSVYVPNSSITIRPHTGSGPCIHELSQGSQSSRQLVMRGDVEPRSAQETFWVFET